MTAYSADDLFREVQSYRRQNEGLHSDIEKAVAKRHKSALRKLIAFVATLVFGNVVGTVVDIVLTWFLSE